MRVAQHVVDARRDKLASILSTRGYLSVPQLCEELKVSEATVRRDLEFLASAGRVTRTYGGVIGDAFVRFPSHQQRMTEAVEAKRTIGERALRWIQPGMTIFIDGGSTLSFTLQALKESNTRNLTFVTISLPAVDLLSSLEEITVYLLGGRFFPRQSVLLGDHTCTAVSEWDFDLSLMSAQGMTREGLWNTNPEVIQVQREVQKRSARSVALIDQSKIGKKTEYFLCDWDDLDGLVTDADSSSLKKEGIPAFNKKTGFLNNFKKNSQENDLTLPTSLL